MASGLYRIRNVINNRLYVGSSKDVMTRWALHKAALRGMRHVNPHLQAAWKKYGENNFVFELISECVESELRFREQQMLDALDWNSTYNISKSADNPTRGRPLSDEHKIKLRTPKSTTINMRLAKLGKKLGSYTEAHRTAISRSLKGKTKSVSHRTKLRIAAQRLSSSEVAEIRMTPKVYGVVRRLAEKFGVHENTIHRIRTGVTYE